MKLGTREYGGIAVMIGAIGIALGMSWNLPDLSMIGTMFFVVGGLVVYFTLDPWYCAMCGQKLGRAKPSECERCGSNRMTRRDPGAGEAVRMKR